MKTRILAAMVLVPVLLVVLLLAPVYVATIVVGLMCGIASYELLFRTGLVTNARLNTYSAVLAFGVAVWSYYGMPYAACLIGIFAYALVLFAEMLASGLRVKFHEVSVCLFSGIVVPLLLTALIRIRMLPNGTWLICIPFLMAFLSDTGAYFVGVFFGKHKLCPVISPKKTVEGFIGGILTAIVGMMVFALIVSHFRIAQVNYWLAFVYGLLGAVAGVMGDLSMSVIKRQTGIKDYGNLIPGHGGILDRFDSVMITAPLTEILLLVIPFMV